MGSGVNSGDQVCASRLEQQVSKVMRDQRVSAKMKENCEKKKNGGYRFEHEERTNGGGRMKLNILL